jgi:chromosome segregation ATPase
LEAADILYGVTMGADGTSEIVSKRLAGRALHAVSA